MTLLHPASTGTRVTVWFTDGEPVRLAGAGMRLRVVGEPKCADINGDRYWRVRALGDDGRVGVFDIREGAGGWVLVGIDAAAHADSAYPQPMIDAMIEVIPDGRSLYRTMAPEDAVIETKLAQKGAWSVRSHGIP